METAFTPLQSLGGGVLIGLAAVLSMALLGRIMGATGVMAGFFSPTGLSDWSWRAALIAGMVSAPLVIFALTGSRPDIAVPVSSSALLIGGFIVGLGVTYGSGCTSGHGVCGMARFSPRSIVATLVFMVACFATVFIIRHVVGG